MNKKLLFGIAFLFAISAGVVCGYNDDGDSGPMPICPGAGAYDDASEAQRAFAYERERSQTPLNGFGFTYLPCEEDDLGICVEPL